MKKKLMLALSIGLIAVAAISGTYAYLTDTDEDVNVMTLGNVDIEQIEQEWNEDGTALVDFTQAKPLYPFVGSFGWENTEEGNGAYRQFTMENVVDKYVSVKNTGKSDAYVRTVIALEMGEYETIEEFRNNVIGVSRNEVDDDEFNFAGSWIWNEDSFFVADIDGNNYMIMVATHHDPVAPGKTTIPSLLQVYMNATATNDTVEKVDGNDSGTYDILVVSQAIQAEGFADAETALNTGFYEVSETAHPWLSAKVIGVSTSEELVDAIANAEKDEIIILSEGEYDLPATTFAVDGLTLVGGGEVVINEPEKNEYVYRIQGDNITFDNLKFHTVYNTGSWTNSITVEADNFVMKNCVMDGRGTNDQLLVISGSAGDVTISNCDFLGAYRQIGNGSGSAGSKVVIEDCTFGGNTTYAVHFDSVNCDVLVKNCEIKGHNAVGKNGNGTFVFEGCKFLAGDVYSQIALHRDVTFEGCTFNQSFALGASKPDLTIVMNNSTWEGWNSCKARLLDDSFSYNLTVICDGDTIVWDNSAKTWVD